ncbi:MAG: phospho-N-acetylmuramoyl-pentapeptide-transferase [Acidobacteriota bacterium]
MIYRLLYSEWLRDQVSGFNVFGYITFRAAMAALTALLLSVMLGPWLIARLRESQIGQEIREEGPSTHAAKSGTPTMGGLLILVSIFVSTLFWGDLQNLSVLVCLGSTAVFGAIGFIDDSRKVRGRQSLGLTPRQKLVLQVVAAAGVGAFVLWQAEVGAVDLRLGVPFIKDFTPDISFFYLPLSVLVIVGAANAVNLTDGLDGLAIGSTGIAFTAYTAVAYVVGHAGLSKYLGVLQVSSAAEVTVFCASVVGAALGFLWFNCPPAAVFMGDTGSMGLGGAIGTVAVVIKQELMLLLIGGLFVIEALSVMLQVASFKLTGTRIFKMAPIHHHFEAHRRDVPSRLAGHQWAESQVVVRFWILAILFAVVGLSSLKVR